MFANFKKAVLTFVGLVLVLYTAFSIYAILDLTDRVNEQSQLMLDILDVIQNQEIRTLRLEQDAGMELPAGFEIRFTPEKPSED